MEGMTRNNGTFHKLGAHFVTMARRMHITLFFMVSDTALSPFHKAYT